MILQNVTMVTLRPGKKGLRVAHVWANPLVAVRDGKPVLGHYARRLLTVKEIAARDGLSLNQASARRREQPLDCLADFPGQAPLEGLVRVAV
jgi:hypothetical protein